MTSPCRGKNYPERNTLSILAKGKVAPFCAPGACLRAARFVLQRETHESRVMTKKILNRY